MHFERSGNQDSSMRLIWLHGWGVDHKSLTQLVNGFSEYDNYLIDLQGFGQSAQPDRVWDTNDYANSITNFLRNLENRTTVVIGHSFGGRVCIQLGANYSKNIDGIVLIGGAGLQYKLNLFFKFYKYFTKFILPLIKKACPSVSKFLSQMASTFKLSSEDYRNADGLMKEIFKKSVNENLEEISKKIELPTLLIYGERDTAAPVYFGCIYNNTIKN
jgi:pimeloyl-ACP methyl ester carboxylesterase